MIDKQRLRTFLIGGVVGALAGILLTPRSGQEIRGTVANRAGEARERSRERYFEAQERMQERFAASREGIRRPEPAPVREPTVGGESSEEFPPKSYGAPDRPPLRDVSRDVVEQPVAEPADGPTEESDARSEELRRKVRETRARLRGRIEADPEGGKESDDV
ncbi:MAG TPA: YtxH domain-containing protein [Rubrobacteraceae bacterium]|nr:YtxH domain-containing protein [Rubrobacteraceae bacterium]